MSEQYRKEKFKSRAECLEWCADNKPIYRTKGFISNPEEISIFEISFWWNHWHKAIEIVSEKRVIEFWVNLYPQGFGVSHKTENEAISNSDDGYIGTIKITKEITIVDGKVVEDE